MNENRALRAGRVLQSTEWKDIEERKGVRRCWEMSYQITQIIQNLILWNSQRWMIVFHSDDEHICFIFLKYTWHECGKTCFVRAHFTDVNSFWFENITERGKKWFWTWIRRWSWRSYTHFMYLSPPLSWYVENCLDDVEKWKTNHNMSPLFGRNRHFFSRIKSVHENMYLVSSRSLRVPMNKTEISTFPCLDH